MSVEGSAVQARHLTERQEYLGTYLGVAYIFIWHGASHETRITIGANCVPADVRPSDDHHRHMVKQTRAEGRIRKTEEAPHICAQAHNHTSPEPRTMAFCSGGRRGGDSSGSLADGASREMAGTQRRERRKRERGESKAVVSSAQEEMDARTYVRPGLLRWVEIIAGGCNPVEFSAGPDPCSRKNFA